MIEPWRKDFGQRDGVAVAEEQLLGEEMPR